MSACVFILKLQVNAMKFKRLGHIMCAVAVAGAAMAMPLLSGCNTNHPKAEITISYNGTQYVLEYKLYRNMYPQTVQHFIELADSGFYDGTIIHNYQTSYWYGGGYDYDEETYETAYEGGSQDIMDYLEANSKEKEYSELADPDNGVITPSVYANIDPTTDEYVNPLNTLIGEISANGHSIDEGALSDEYGSLSFYYTSKSSTDVANKQVYLNKTGTDFGFIGEYQYNSATSLFRIRTTNSTTSVGNYCVFAMLQNQDTLTELKEAISDDSVSSKSSSQLYVDNYDSLVGARENYVSSYTIPSTAIIIEKVEITKY